MHSSESIPIKHKSSTYPIPTLSQFVDAKEMGESIFRQLDSPLWVLTAARKPQEGVVQNASTEPTFTDFNGMVVACVTAGSLPTNKHSRVVVTCSFDNLTTSLIRETGRFALNLLSTEQIDLVSHFGLQSGNQVQKFSAAFVRDHVDLENSVLSCDGDPPQLNCDPEKKVDNFPHRRLILANACAWMDCCVVAHVDFPDSTIFVADVLIQKTQIDVSKLQERSVAAQKRFQTKAPSFDIPLTRHTYNTTQPLQAKIHKEQIEEDTQTHFAKMGLSNS